MYAATRTGVYRSLDGGVTFNPVAGITPANGCLDLAIRTDTGSADTVFASCGTFTQSTIYRNTDAGGAGTWGSVYSVAGGGRAALAIAPSAQGTIYALDRPRATITTCTRSCARRPAAPPDPGRCGPAPLRRTRSTARCSPTRSSGSASAQNFNQGWYDNVIAVDPANPEIVWTGGVDLFRSNDGGTTFGLASWWWLTPGLADYSHADQHAIVFHPDYNGTTNTTMFVGNDGGIHRTSNARAAVSTDPNDACQGAVIDNAVNWTSLNNGYSVTQFYDGTPYPNGATYFGGTQDNGTLRGSTAGPNWSEILGGDGGYVAVDPTNTNVLFVENTRLSIQKSTNGGASFTDAVSGITDNNFLFIAPFQMAEANHNVLFTGGWFLWRTTNSAGSWQQASAITPGNGSVSAVTSHQTNADLALAGMSDGFILRQTAALSSGSGTTWPNVQPRTGYVSSLTYDPVDTNVAYATYATFGGGAHVWKTTNGGANWTALDGTGGNVIPDIPVHSIAVNPVDTSHLYAGTDLGVFVSLDGGINWARENNGLANVMVDDLDILTVGEQVYLYAFTHGRSAYRVRLTTVAPVPALSISNASLTEPDSGTAAMTFTVTASAAPTGAVTVRAKTVNGSATAPADYTALPAAGTLVTFSAGETSRTVSVPIVGDLKKEPNETFAVTLSSPTNATIADGSGTGTIVNDDTCTIVGTNGNNTLNGTAGNDVICGLSGNDVINGRGGNDVINGGTGIDRGSWAGAPAAVAINLATNRATGWGTDTLASIEQALGGGGRDTITGNAGANSLLGGNGNDRLDGGAGSDRVDGGDGVDLVKGGLGVDTVLGGPGNDNSPTGTTAGVHGGPGTDAINGGPGVDYCSVRAAGETRVSCERP